MPGRLSTLVDVLEGSDDALAIQVGSGGARITRSEFRKLVVQTANTLQDSGVRPGDTITIADANTVRVHRQHRTTPAARAECMRNGHRRDLKPGSGQMNYVALLVH